MQRMKKLPVILPKSWLSFVNLWGPSIVFNPSQNFSFTSEKSSENSRRIRLFFKLLQEGPTYNLWSLTGAFIGKVLEKLIEVWF